MTGYSFARARARFLLAATATASVGLLGGWGVRGTVRRAALIGGAVAASDYALYRVLGELPALETELDERVDEIEIDLEDFDVEE
jgi:hypothetical protein